MAANQKFAAVVKLVLYKQQTPRSQVRILSPRLTSQDPALRVERKMSAKTRGFFFVSPQRAS